eukprot:1161727-Pelagomonas_calceolata.AAC.23
MRILVRSNCEALDSTLPTAVLRNRHLQSLNGIVHREAENKRKREADGAGPANQGARLTLRPYQAEPAIFPSLTPQAVKAIESRKPEKRNWVVAAPTNSGKTAIFITVARATSTHVAKLQR